MTNLIECPTCYTYSYNSGYTHKSYPKDQMCKDCVQCPTHCICNAPQFFKSKLHFHKSKKFKLNKSHRFIATEIEVAKIKKDKQSANLLFKTIRNWQGSVVYDGSLPETTGFEITTAPANGDAFIEQITDICEVLEKASGEVNNNCGLHVHVDARDFTFDDIKKLIKVYAVVEPALFSLVPSRRKQVRYCKPCGEKYEKVIQGNSKSFFEIKNKIVVGTYGALSTDGYNKKYNDARYNALNIHSWFYRGTIECRMLEGTLDKNDIINWCILWANILDFVLNTSDKKINTLMDKNHSVNSLLKIIEKNKDIIEFIEKRYKKYNKGIK